MTMVSVFFKAQGEGCRCECLTRYKEPRHCPPQALLSEASSWGVTFPEFGVPGTGVHNGHI